ncbi:unnamed protein product [Effrenium voratum]|nr:unnamed protein product [Effrenium voratum]|eukprot:CAMPEP_0181418332 /NCGR_PEP_ID=MMETSP1110-20121109/11500_1 /TAXON_ID=174948 /ORGANISM="Symbiodinium sp., Strain CCMP421" /LENGTH=426 /DNA_ID=CAMNT_0023541307 /DNA_START=75 /DNA_END=1355 /DNA_ORIENTATION=+
MFRLILSVAAGWAVQGLKRKTCDLYDYFATGDDQIFAYKIEHKEHQVQARWDVTDGGKKAGSLSWALNFVNEKGENRVGVTSEDHSKFYIFDPCVQAPGDRPLKLAQPVVDLTCSGKITQPVGASFDDSNGKIYFAMFKAGLAVLDVKSASSDAVQCYPYGDIENDFIHNVEVMNIGKNGQKRNEVFVNHLGNIWGPSGWKGRGLLWFNKKTLRFEHVISNEEVAGAPGISLRSAHIDANFESSNVIWGLTQETCPLPTKIYKFEVTATADSVALKATLMGTLADRGTDKVVAGDGGADIISRWNVERTETELLATDRYGSNSGGEPALPGKIYVFSDSKSGALSSMSKLPEPTVILPTGKDGYPRRTEVLRDSWVISANHGPPGEPLSVYAYPLEEHSAFQSPAAPAMAGYIVENGASRKEVILE